jgi:hypothetical protein
MFCKQTNPKRYHSVIWLALILLLALPLSSCIAPEDPLILEAPNGTVPAEEGELLAEQDPQISIAEVEITRTEDQPGVGAEAAATAEMPSEQMLARATFLLGLAVESPDGEQVGYIDDFIIGVESGQVAYVVLDRSELLGLIGDRRPVPSALLEWGPELQPVLTIGQEMLDLAPQLNDDWPAGDEGWNVEVIEFWRQHGLLPEVGQEEILARVRDLIGIHAGGLGEDLGVVEDFLIDLQAGASAYVAIFSSSGFYDPDRVLILPVAVTELAVEMADGGPAYALAMLAVDSQTLEAAPSVDRSVFLTIDLVGPQIAQELAAYWEEE